MMDCTVSIHLPPLKNLPRYHHHLPPLKKGGRGGLRIGNSHKIPPSPPLLKGGTERMRGMVLVIVLWIVTLLTVMAGSFAYSMRVETRLATTMIERAQARALAEAAATYVLAWQLDFAAQKQWPANGDVHEWAFGGSRVRISIEDAAGRVSLNNANTLLLKETLLGIGVNEADVDHQVAAIEDWRDPDDQTRPDGAESAEYRAAGRPGPKNGSFDSLEELQQVLGIDPETARRFARVATVDTRISGINPTLASIDVLRATTGLDEKTIADYVNARAQTAREDAPPPPLPAMDGRSFFSGSRSGVYHIAAMVETETGTTVRVEAVASTQNPPPGQMVRWLSWRLAP
ncbi:MAG: general secretion pathway protein GspK [Candidatus Competibacteraceae bacterium]|nr:general secretion pathway protein GspK [Candidatus Competibacteraceae bacterium]MCP5125466.1 general secretion pathway protein GspK [Gammaproteobacteria bacterium]HRX69565.1 type II secretion system protein GspK [Candidatus Competibacteraceae bacterium]